MFRKFFLSLLIIFIFGTITVGSVMVILQFKSEATKSPGVVEKLNLEVLSLSPLPFEETLSGLGTLEPLRRARVVSEISGQVTYRSPLLEAGNQVDTETLLVQVAPQRMKLQEEMAKAAWEQAKIQKEQLEIEEKALILFRDIYKKNLTLAEQQEKETELLLKKQATSKYDLDNARLRTRQELFNLANMEYKIQLVPRRREELEKVILLRHKEYLLAKRNHELSRVQAPFPGRIVSRVIEVGQKTEMGQFFFEMIDNTLVAKIDFPVQYTERLRKGLKTDLTCPSLEGHWQGEIERIHPELNPLNRTVTVYIRLKGPYKNLRPGLFIRGTIKIQKHPQAIVIPRMALREQERVLVLEKGIIQERHLKIRRYVGNQILVEEGLKEGDYLILSQVEGLIVGQKATPKVLSQKKKKSPFPSKT